MKRYDLTEDGYRRNFRASKPEVDESPEQFIVRLDRYLLRWLELSDTAQTYDGLKDLIVKEQFIDSCPKDLAIHLRERAPETLAKIAKIADQYLEAHGKHLFSPVSRNLAEELEDEAENTQSNSTAIQCILFPRAHDPSGLWQGSRALAVPDFLSMRRAFVSYSRPIRFDGKSVNRGLPVLDQARALEPCHRPEGSWALGTRMPSSAIIVMPVVIKL